MATKSRRSSASENGAGSEAPDDAEGFGLAETLAALTADLLAAERKAATGPNAGLVVDDVEVELTVALARKGSGEIGTPRFWVVPIHAKGSYGQDHTRTHRVTIRLRPHADDSPAANPGNLTDPGAVTVTTNDGTTSVVHRQPPDPSPTRRTSPQAPIQPRANSKARPVAGVEPGPSNRGGGQRGSRPGGSAGVDF